MSLIKRNTAYSLNDIVNTKYGAKLKCTTAGTTSTDPLILDGTSPITDGTVVWEVQEQGGSGQGLVDYEANKNYSVGDIVIYDDKIYRCKTAHTSTSTFDTTKFDLISGGGGGGSSASIEYQLLDTPYTCTSTKTELTLNDDPINYDLIYICWHMVASNGGIRRHSNVITNQQYTDMLESTGIDVGVLSFSASTNSSASFSRVLIYPVEGGFEALSSSNGSETRNVIIDNIIGIKYITPYSSEEQRIGTWIDGKPLYQVIITGYTTSGGDIDYPINYNIDKIISAECMLGSSDGSNFRPLTYYAGGDYASIICQKTRFHLYLNGISNFTYYLTIKYTKT